MLGLHNAGQLPVAQLTGSREGVNLYTKSTLARFGKVAGRALCRFLFYRSEFYRKVAIRARIFPLHPIQRAQTVRSTPPQNADASHRQAGRRSLVSGRRIWSGRSSGRSGSRKAASERSQRSSHPTSRLIPPRPTSSASRLPPPRPAPEARRPE